MAVRCHSLSDSTSENILRCGLAFCTLLAYCRTRKLEPDMATWGHCFSMYNKHDITLSCMIGCPTFVFAKKHLLTLDCNHENPSNYLCTYAQSSAFNESQTQWLSLKKMCMISLNDGFALKYYPQNNIASAGFVNCKLAVPLICLLSNNHSQMHSQCWTKLKCEQHHTSTTSVPPFCMRLVK